ncbi:acyltransferase family protein [uncultured Clostridium sp.]
MAIYMFIYIFHMPLFIYISGYLSKNVNKSKKLFLKDLLIPYIFLNIIWYVLAYIYTGEVNLPIIYPGWTLWFLLSLFFWRSSLKYLIKIKYILPISFILGILTGLISNGAILSFSRTVVFLPFFLLGYYTDTEKIKYIFKKVNIGVCIFGILVFIIASFVIVNKNILDYRFLYGSHSYKELGISIHIGIISRILLYISSILLSLFVSYIIPTNKTFFTHIGKSTMYIYAFHTYIVLIIFYFLPSWNKSFLTNFIIIISPLLVTYTLSYKFFERTYNMMLNPIRKLIK